MSVIDPDGSFVSCAREVLEEENYFYVKDSYENIFKIKLDKKIFVLVSEGENYKCYSYSVCVSNRLNLVQKTQKFLFAALGKEFKPAEKYLKIKESFYSQDFYSRYSPSGLVMKDQLYQTFDDAKNGEKIAWLFSPSNN